MSVYQRLHSLLASFAAATTAVLLTAPSQAADQSLIDAAKKEGEVVWYTTIIVNQLARPLSNAFEKKYGVKVRYARSNDHDATLKIINEANAGQVQADVVDGIGGALALKNAGLLAKYIPDSAENFAAEYKDEEGQWVATHAYYLTPGVNTNLVPKKDAPKTYEDLLDPKWRGKMGWNSAVATSGASGFIGNVLTTMGEQKGMEYLRKLAGQKIINMDASARQVLDRAIAGEFPIALQIFNHHTVISAKKGAPVDWIKMEPVMSVLSVVSLIKSAPHPNAGKLLIDYMVSEEGQRLFEKADYLPVHPEVPASTPSLTPKGGNYKVNIMTPELLGEKLPSWNKIAEDLFR